MSCKFTNLKPREDIQKFLLFLLFLSVLSCDTHSEKVLVDISYEDVRNDVCISNLQNKYHILQPADKIPSQKLPLVIIIDAHGDGKMAVNKFRPAVKYFPCLLLGSDLVKNNFPDYEQAISQILSDAKAKYPVDEKHIIISGFSGGARMAYSYSLHHQVSGVIMCGAGPGQQMPACPLYAISGMGDFNFGEQYVRPKITSFDNQEYITDYFHGIHEWPQAEQLSDALLFLLRDDSYTEKIRQNRSKKLLQLADSLENEGDAIMAWKAIEKSAKLSVNQKGRSQAEKQGKALLERIGFQKAFASLEKYLQQENRLRKAYADRLLTENTEWWKKELRSLQERLEAEPPGLTTDHYLRIKGYLGIMLYSNVNYLIHNDPGNPHMEQILDIYEFAEPENPDPWFFKALNAYHAGNINLCLENLKRSMELGFSDGKKLAAEFPESILEGLNKLLN